MEKYKYKIGDKVEYLTAFDVKKVGVIQSRYCETVGSNMVKYYKIDGLSRSEKRIIFKFK